MELQYRRPDGSFVAIINGLPYHVTADDQHFEAATAAAGELGDDLPFEPEAPLVETPIPDISDRQFAQGLAELELISEAEAEEWVAAGTLPPALLDLVNELPSEQRFPARMLLRGATKFEYGHPLAQTFAQLADPPWSDEARTDFWWHCAGL